MPAIANIVLGTVTFNPNKVDGITARYFNRAPTYPIGYYPLSLSLREPVNGNGTYKAVAEIAIPKTATVVDGDGNTKVVVTHTLRAKVEYYIPAVASSADRTELYDKVKELTAHATTGSVVKDLENIW